MEHQPADAMAAAMTVEQAATALGVAVGYVEELYRALEIRIDETGLVRGDDVALLRSLLELVAATGGSASTAVVLARSLGHHCARLAMWQVLGLAEDFGRQLPPDEAALRTEQVVRLDQDAAGRLLVQVWRRHVDTVLDWRLARAGQEVHRLLISVGFADLVGYTEITRGLDGRAVAALVRGFERITVEVVSKHAGRLVKTLGDGVLYVADDVAAAVDIGLELADRTAADTALPQVRVGISTGEVTAVLGDVHGPTVNLAHRLTTAAEPGTVRVDATTAAHAAGIPHMAVTTLAASPLRGLGELPSWRITRASDS